MISTASVFVTKIRFAYLAILYVPSLLSRLDNNGGIGLFIISCTISCVAKCCYIIAVSNCAIVREQIFIIVLSRAHHKDAAIASFCATNVTERFDHLPENADEDAAPQLSPPQWLSAIELLRYPDREVFRVDRRMVFQTIYQKLTQQVEEVQSDRIQIHNERYRLTKKDVRSNMERCLDMVKVQFPDKEPLIQEMIRSIR